MVLIEKINQESEKALSQFFDSKSKNPELEDIHLNNKFNVHQFLKDKFISSEVTLIINFSLFSYEDAMKFTPLVNKIFTWVLLLIVVIFPFIVKPVWMFLFPLILLIISLVINFISFQKKIKQTIVNDFCAFELWYDKQFFSFIYNGKEYKFPENWGNLLVRMKMDKAT